ncbi:MAG: hypothetical protein PUI29_03215 [Aeromonadales bacterium]|nr:hypothetical protein [Aeromonadales bacterium]MDY2890952.1 hypothetical protein [Succinivibrio sp.]
MYKIDNIQRNGNNLKMTVQSAGQGKSFFVLQKIKNYWSLFKSYPLLPIMRRAVHEAQQGGRIMAAVLLRLIGQGGQCGTGCLNNKNNIKCPPFD